LLINELGNDMVCIIVSVVLCILDIGIVWSRECFGLD